MSVETLEIEGLIRAALPEATIEVSSHDGRHYTATVIAEEFKGLNRVKQHQLVYAALKDKIAGPAGDLHALALTTKAPE